jgi:hypothetical protein
MEGEGTGKHLNEVSMNPSTSEASNKKGLSQPTKGASADHGTCSMTTSQPSGPSKTGLGG